MRFEGQLLKRGLVVGVAQTQAAVASFATSPNGAVRGDDECAILTGFDLELQTVSSCLSFKYRTEFWILIGQKVTNQVH